MEPDREERQKYFAGASSHLFYLPHSSAAEINKTGLYLTNIPRADKKLIKGTVS